MCDAGVVHRRCGTRRRETMLKKYLYFIVLTTIAGQSIASSRAPAQRAEQAVVNLSAPLRTALASLINRLMESVCDDALRKETLELVARLRAAGAEQQAQFLFDIQVNIDARTNSEVSVINCPGGPTGLKPEQPSASIRIQSTDIEEKK